MVAWGSVGDLLILRGLVLDMLAVWDLKRVEGCRRAARRGIRGGILGGLTDRFINLGLGIRE